MRNEGFALLIWICYGEMLLALVEFARPTLICFVKNADSST